MDTERMMERARRIMAGYTVSHTTETEWADALLAEHAARVAAERERDKAVEALNRRRRQVAPTEPPWPIPVHIGDNGAVYPLAAPQVAPEDLAPQGEPSRPPGVSDKSAAAVDEVLRLTRVRMVREVRERCTDRTSDYARLAAPEVAPTEPPTWQQAEDVYGFDAMREPLRAAAPDRCDECGGLVKGFFANFLRRCPNDWHIVREEWEHGLGPAPQGEGNTDE